MTNKSIDRYWNTIDIYAQEAGSYTILFGYADKGPSLVPVYIKSEDEAINIFGPNSVLYFEYLEYIRNGGQNIWLVRINGSHFRYNIERLFSITSLVGLYEADNFYYRVWDNNNIQFITIGLNLEEYTYNLSDLSIKEICEQINGEANLLSVPFFATYLSEGTPANHVSDEEEKIFVINGANNYTETEFISCFYENILDLIENLTPSIIGFSQIDITTSAFSQYDFFIKLNEVLNKKLDGTINSIPIVCIVPILGSVEDIIYKSNNLTEYIIENPASSNIHTETLSFPTGIITNRTKYSPIIENSYELFIVEEDGSISEIEEGVCTFDENYGIIDILDEEYLPISITIEYSVSGIDLYKMFCIIASPLPAAESNIYTTGVGALTANILSTGLDGSIKTKNIFSVSDSILPNMSTTEQSTLKKNGIIFNKTILIGNTLYYKYANDKTFYSFIEKENPIIETANINLIRQIVTELSKYLEYAFVKGTLIQIDSIISSIMNKYTRYIQYYDYRYEEILDNTFLKNYEIELDLYINSVLTTLKLGYSL